MSKKIRKNQTIIDEFIKSPIGIINGEQINLKNFEISKNLPI